MKKTEIKLPLADGNILQVQNNWWDPSHPAEVYITIQDTSGKNIQDIAYIGESDTNHHGSGEPIADIPEAIKVMVYTNYEREDPSFVKDIYVRRNR